ncbi:hypothetical protein RCL_jg22493.t1 [Rhizophagus clarus]|uniref:Uncharacterized protein n=1 Tax=Rhizophagus clarus TaxID=94130 RepID=A0A8H3MFG1_9GLOM|nr:hypothetical protein RCL_jg22493.t1 [Rhizophagus clarus]
MSNGTTHHSLNEKCEDLWHHCLKMGIPNFKDQFAAYNIPGVIQEGQPRLNPSPNIERWEDNTNNRY